MALNNVADVNKKESDAKYKLVLNEKLNFEDVPLTKDTTCGFWFFKGSLLQKFANKKSYVVLYGLLGCLFSATHAYHNGSITTIEKRFKIPSRTTGIILIGNDVSQMFVAVILSYYTGRKHRPRWMAAGLLTAVMYCIITTSPHWFYGPGEEALSLTKEYGAGQNTTNEIELRKTLCRSNNLTSGCEIESGNYTPPIIFFLAQFISGIGAPLYNTLGVSYMDDNIKKSKTPALISLSYFLRLLGPAIGYTLASYCLSIYIAPDLTPTIAKNDPRWLGAWWMGWAFLGGLLLFFGFLISLFPKTLPRAAARKLQQQASTGSQPEPEIDTSYKDMIKTFRRILTNKIFMVNNMASVFYFFGYSPYWIFLPKYIETQYRQSSSTSSLVTGTVGLVCSAFGVLSSGLYISQFKPKARSLAGWNVIVGAVSIFGIISYSLLGCVENDNKYLLNEIGQLNPNLECNANCGCDYVKYSPVCSLDGKTGFISPCHAGCKGEEIINKTKLFTDCSCVSPPLSANETIFEGGGIVKEGSCPVDCMTKFYIFLSVLCLLKFSGATGRASNFLVSMRCVEEKDKSVSIAFNIALMSLFSFIPAPVIFGVILDNACLLWGKTCTSKGNCWLYDGEVLRTTLNFTAVTFVIIGTFFDGVVWYLVKDLKIFDDEEKETEAEELKKVDEDAKDN